MATIAATMSWSDLEDRRDLRRYLGIAPENTSEDTRLERWFAEAIGHGDLWLANPFTDDDNNDLPFPDAVRVGVWEYVKTLRQRFGNRAGAKSVKTDRLAETYADAGFAAQAALANAIPHWRPYQLQTWLAGRMAS